MSMSFRTGGKKACVDRSLDPYARIIKILACKYCLDWFLYWLGVDFRQDPRWPPLFMLKSGTFPGIVRKARKVVPSPPIAKTRSRLMSFNSSGLIGIASLITEGRTELTLIFLLLLSHLCSFTSLSASLLPTLWLSPRCECSVSSHRTAIARRVLKCLYF